MKRTTALIGVLLLTSVSGSAAQTKKEEVNKFKERVLHDDLTVLDAACPEGRTQVQTKLCLFAVTTILNDLADRGYLGSSFCPPPGITYNTLFNTIDEYLIKEKPLRTKRAVDVVQDAMMHTYPCRH